MEKMYFLAAFFGILLSPKNGLKQPDDAYLLKYSYSLIRSGFSLCFVITPSPCFNTLLNIINNSYCFMTMVL